MPRKTGKRPTKKKEPERKEVVCTRCGKLIHGQPVEIITRRRSRLVLCMECYKTGL